MRVEQIGVVVDPVRSWNPRREANGEPITYIDIASVSQTEKSIIAAQSIVGADAPSRARQLVAKGDILVSTVRPNLNAVAMVSEDEDGATASTGFTVLRPRRERIEPRYLFHWVRSPKFIAEMVRQATGQSYPAVSDRIVKSSAIPLPSLKEQKRIVAILDQADALRRLRRHALDRLTTLGQSIFHEMFGDPMSNPMGWPIVRLGEIGDLDRGISRHRPRNDPALLGGPYPLVQTGDVSNAIDYITEYKFTYSEAGRAQSKLWPAGTLCITIAANIADTAILDFEACFPDSVVGFSSNDTALNFFVHRWFCEVKDEIERVAPTVAQKNINLALLRELPVPIPPLTAIKKFFTREKRGRGVFETSKRHYIRLNNFYGSLQSRAFEGGL